MPGWTQISEINPLRRGNKVHTRDGRRARDDRRRAGHTLVQRGHPPRQRKRRGRAWRVERLIGRAHVVVGIVYAWRQRARARRTMLHILFVGGVVVVRMMGLLFRLSLHLARAARAPLRLVACTPSTVEANDGPIDGAAPPCVIPELGPVLLQGAT